MIKKARGIIFQGGRVLLGLNAMGDWRLPGGTLEKGEHPVDAYIREIKEETGIDVTSHNTVVEYELGNEKYYLCCLNQPVQVTCANDPDHEFEHLDWFSTSQLPELSDNAESALYHMLRCVTQVKADVEVLVDGKVYCKLPDDEIWQTMPRLAQLRAKGHKLSYRQTLPGGEVIDFDLAVMPNYMKTQ